MPPQEGLGRGRQAASVVAVVEGVGIAIEWGAPVVAVAVVSRL
jgi:hypothetical protein